MAVLILSSGVNFCAGERAALTQRADRMLSYVLNPPIARFCHAS
jgi:hypothetical protein